MSKKIKKRMPFKDTRRTLQRMQTYTNGMVKVLNDHQADPNEALASAFAVAVRLARSKGTGKAQFIDEASSAWTNLRKLPIDHDEMVLMDARPWYKEPKVILSVLLFSGIHWALFAAYLLRVA